MRFACLAARSLTRRLTRAALIELAAEVRRTIDTEYDVVRVTDQTAKMLVAQMILGRIRTCEDAYAPFFIAVLERRCAALNVTIVETGENVESSQHGRGLAVWPRLIAIIQMDQNAGRDAPRRGDRRRQQIYEFQQMVQPGTLAGRSLLFEHQG